MKKISELPIGLTKKIEPTLDQPVLPTEESEQEEALKRDIENLSSKLVYSKREEWEIDLKEFGMTNHDAAVVLDSIISRGIYEESYKYGKIIFKLRTRSAADSDRLIEMVQEFQPKTTGILQHLIARVNLASSLSCYADSTFSFSVPTDSNREELDIEFNERYRFISKLPQTVFLALTQVLERFDKRVMLASDPRSLENF